MRSDSPLGRMRPPRRITLPARLAVLFGGIFALIGSLLTGFGMIFFWAFVMSSELVHLDLGFRSWQAHPARIVVAEETGASENEEDVVRYVYEYEVGREVLAGRGYTTGWRWDEGQAVQIEIDPEDPGVSRLPGTRRAAFGAAAGLAGIFPLIGVLLLFFSVRANRRTLQLLVNGIYTTGRVVNREATNTTINDERVYRYTIEYASDGGSTHRFETRTHRSELVEDDELEELLYDPQNPDHGSLLDTLGVVPPPGPDGALCIGPGGALRSLAAPTVCLLPHVAWAIWRYAL